MNAVVRGLLIALVVAGTALPAAAQRKYAVASAIGDRLTVVTRVMGTGSNIADPNKRDTMELSTPALDNAALLAIEDGLKTANGKADVVLLAPRTPLAERAATAARDGTLDQWIATDARAQLGPMGVTHVIVVAKYRGDTRIATRNGSTGSGKLEGLGFYLDRSYMRDDDSSTSLPTGLLAAYAYFIVRLYDLQTGTKIGEQFVSASTSAIPGADRVNAWDAMTPVEKVTAVRDLVTTEVARAAAALPPR